MYLHTPAVEAGSWWRVDTASGSDTGTTVYAYDGTGPIPNYYVLTGSTVRNTSWDGTARFWSATQTLYLKELTYQGAPNGTVVTSTGVTPAAPVGGAPVDIATISTTVAALPTTYAHLLTTDATSTAASGTLTAWHLTPVDATSAPATWTLPAASSVAAGVETAVKKADTSANTVTASRAGSDLIFGTGSGSTSKVLTLAGEAITFVSNGVDRWTVQTSDTPSGVLASTYLTQASATGTYAQARYPAAATAAGVTATVYDPIRCVWNLGAGSFSKGRAKLGAALAGTGLCKVAIVGDSSSAGIGSGNSREKSWPAYLGNLLPSGLAIAGTGPVSASQSPLSSQWTIGSGWTVFASGSNQYLECANSSAGPLTFVSTVAGTVVEIMYGNNRATGTFTYAIDGGSAVTITPGGTNAIVKTTVTGLANTTHTVVIQPTGSAGVDFWSCEVRKTTGLIIGNVAQNGKLSADWADGSQWYYLKKWLQLWAPDIVIVDLGINDWNTLVSTSTFQTNLNTITADYTGADYALVVPHPTNPAAQAGALRVNYDKLIYTVAQTKSLPVVDLTEYMVSYANANALSLYSDNYHGTPECYAAEAKAFVPLLVA